MNFGISTSHLSFFISEKVQVEAPELILGGNACNFIEILKYGKLEIGLRRDLRDFAIFLFMSGFSGDRTLDIWIQRPTR